MDPLAHLAPDLTPYHYTHNNPLNRYDPDGRTDWEALGWAALRTSGGFGTLMLGGAIFEAGIVLEPPSFGTS